jgi:hypothetical protein
MRTNSLLAFNKTPPANTDNKGHLICHIFCNLRLLPRQIRNSLYRARASAFYKALCTLTCDQFAIKFVPRHSYNSIKLVLGRQKMRHASLNYGCTGTLPRFGFSTNSLHSLSNTNALYCRAVIRHSNSCT